MTLDSVNGSFEILGGVLTWMNVRALLRDREVKGVSWGVQAFFTAWGLWNLWYYPALGQMWSFCGGIVLAAGNLAWVGLALYMRRGNVSDTFDHEAEAWEAYANRYEESFDESDQLEPRRRCHAVRKSCKYCGQTGLRWNNTELGWRLVDAEGRQHRCDQFAVAKADELARKLGVTAGEAKSGSGDLPF